MKEQSPRSIRATRPVRSWATRQPSRGSTSATGPWMASRLSRTSSAAGSSPAPHCPLLPRCSSRNASGPRGRGLQVSKPGLPITNCGPNVADVPVALTGSPPFRGSYCTETSTLFAGNETSWSTIRLGGSRSTGWPDSASRTSTALQYIWLSLSHARRQATWFRILISLFVFKAELSQSDTVLPAALGGASPVSQVPSPSASPDEGARACSSSSRFFFSRASAIRTHARQRLGLTTLRLPSTEISGKDRARDRSAASTDRSLGLLQSDQQASGTSPGLRGLASPPPSLGIAGRRCPSVEKTKWSRSPVELE
mmetsp:Transcript_25980/g.61775  ORF Transcript_25980/g.61775 Transcript_25980/m.61775 type:complete len:311 (+) Transcript_25980:951-1883(+)